MRGLLGFVVAAPLLALAALSPPAAACSIVGASPFQALHWLDEQRMLTNEDYDLGELTLQPPTWRQEAELFFSLRRYAVSPDGQWLVYSYQDGLGADCSGSAYHTRAKNLDTGQEVQLHARPMHVHGSDWGVLVADARTGAAWRYDWGEWSRAVSVDRPGDEWAYGDQALPPTPWILIEVKPGLSLFDPVNRTRIALPETASDDWDRLRAAASPDGRHVAIATPTYASDGNTPRLALRIWAVDEGRAWVRAAITLPIDAAYAYEHGLDWSPDGLALTTRDRVHWFPDAPDLGARRSVAALDEIHGVARWSPHTQRLAVGDGQTLRILDLATGFEHRIVRENGGYRDGGLHAFQTQTSRGLSGLQESPTSHPPTSGEPHPLPGVAALGAALALVMACWATRRR